MKIENTWECVSTIATIVLGVSFIGDMVYRVFSGLEYNPVHNIVVCVLATLSTIGICYLCLVGYVHWFPKEEEDLRIRKDYSI